MKNYEKGFIIPLLAIIILLVTGAVVYVYKDKGNKASLENSDPVIATESINTGTSPKKASIQVLSPNGSEKLFRGQPYSIKWKDYNLYDNNKVVIYLIDTRTDDVIEIAPANYVRSSGIDGTSSFNWNVPTDIAPGDNVFKIEIRELQVGVKDMSDMPFTIGDQIPDIVKSITTYPETGDKKPEYDSLNMVQVKKDIQAGKFTWFHDPVEVASKYGHAFGISADSQYYIETAAVAGENSGLMHSTVLANSNEKSYRIYLISEQDKPYVWLINAVSDISQSSKLKVNWFGSESTFDVDGIGHQEIVTKFGDGTTLFYLNVKKPIVDFYLNQPALPSSVNPDAIVVEIDSIRFGGFTAKAITEQTSSHGVTFPTHSIQVDLSGLPNLKSYSGKNIRITLTDKIKDTSGNPLQQCDRSYNKGECVSDVSGQKIKVFGAELKLYSI